MRTAAFTVLALLAAAGVAHATDVELRADDPRVRIERLVGEGQTQPICSAPCRQPLDPRALYVIGGDGIPATRPFALPDDQQQLILSVRPGSRAKQIGGGVLLGVGATATVLGFLLAPGDPPSQSSDRMGSVNGWPIVVGVTGIAVGLVGAYLLLWSGQTRVESSSGRSF
jgi:hypothetical protein